MKAATAAAKKAAAEKEGKEVEEEEPVPMEEEAEEEEEVEVDFEGVDIFGLDDVDDIGDGMPLQKDFASEDWTLISLWFELHLLAHAFKKDCNDEERLGVTLDHLAFYYSKYYRKNLDLKSFGVESFGDLVNLAKDAVLVNKDGVLESNLDEEMENSQVFVKMAEEARRFRTLEIDMGKEDVKLKFQTPQMQMPQIPISAVGNFPAMVANIAGGNAMVGKGTKGKGNGKGVFSQGFGGQDFGKGKGKGKWQQQQKGW
ncbi:unnamed protein product [Polarella glacialis]|uniref:Uncharacterized protein n=1 Tax=Polarella glacialis TaxID=89957 RepID=A0A813L0G6_POLGL|nr:unnamed protein product [Polarella glacialis]